MTISSFKRFIVPLLVFVGISQPALTQSVPLKTKFVFSAIRGSSSRPDSLTVPTSNVRIEKSGGDTANFSFSLNKKNRRVKLFFVPPGDFIGISRCTLVIVDHVGRKIATVYLTGLSTRGLEGNNEAPLADIMNALGYTANTGWTTLDNNTLPALSGDEIGTAVFQKAGKGKVEILPVARYSPDFLLPFGYYINKSEMPDKHEVGVLAKAGTFPEHQCLYPALASGASSFDPGNESFGFYANGPDHTAYS